MYSFFMFVLRLKYPCEYSAERLGLVRICLKSGACPIYRFRGLMTSEEAKARDAWPVKMHAGAYSLDGG